MFAEIPWVAVVIAVVVNMALAMFWYSPSLLGTRWAEAHKFDMTGAGPTSWHFIGAAVVSLVMATVLAHLTREFHIDTAEKAVSTGFWLWLGLIATSFFSGVLWARKPFLVYLIDTSYLLIIIIFMMVLFALWQ